MFYFLNFTLVLLKRKIQKNFEILQVVLQLYVIHLPDFPGQETVK